MLFQARLKLNSDQLAQENVSEDEVKRLRNYRVELQGQYASRTADLGRLQKQAKRQRLSRLKRCVVTELLVNRMFYLAALLF